VTSRTATRRRPTNGATTSNSVSARGARSSWSRGRESEDNNNGDTNDFSACLPNQISGISGIYGREYVMDFPTKAPLVRVVRVVQASSNLTFEGTRWTCARGDSHWRWLERVIDDGRALGPQWIIVTSIHDLAVTAA